MQLSKLLSKPGNKPRLNNLILITIILLFGLFVLPTKTQAATVYLLPASETVSVDTAFDVGLEIDTEGENTTATDVLFNYDPSMLEVTNVVFSSPSLYPINTKTIDNTNGKLLITSTQRDAVNYYTGSSTLATLTLRVKAPGTASLVFACETGKTNDSNMFKTGSNQDIINCASLENGLYSTTGTAVTRYPTPTMIAPGSVTTTGLILGAGTLLLGIGTLLVFVL